MCPHRLRCSGEHEALLSVVLRKGTGEGHKEWVRLEVGTSQLPLGNGK